MTLGAARVLRREGDAPGGETWAAQGEADNSRRYLSSRVAEHFRVAGKVVSSALVRESVG